MQKKKCTIKYRLLDSYTNTLRCYIIVEDSDIAKKEISILYKDICKYAVTNAYVNKKTCIVKAKRGAVIKTLTLREYNKRFIQKGFDRDVTQAFDTWLSDIKKYNKNQALYVTGARQIGKTFTIQQFCYANFDNVLYIDVRNSKEFRGLMSICEDYDCARRVYEYARERGVFLTFDYNTVIVLDEVQADVVNVFNKLRMLLSELKCCIIMTGSYLGVLNAKDTFWSIGNVVQVNMYPMSFSEVLKALSDTDPKALYMLYRQYGGYPAIVTAYLISKLPESKISDMFETMWGMFLSECLGYVEKDNVAVIDITIFRVIVELIREKTGSQLKEFKFLRNMELNSDKQTHITRKMTEYTIAWLVGCGILQPINMYGTGNITDSPTNVRYYLNDCGLLNYFLRKVATPDNSAKAGLITENFVFTELRSKGENVSTAIYNDGQNRYELDFIIYDYVTNRRIGIEVKTTDGDPISAKVLKRRGLITDFYKVCQVSGENSILLWELYKTKL